MTVLSLFDGISAARVALERAGIKVDRYYASEIKPAAIKIAQAMFPDTIQLGDVTKIDFTVLPKIDFIVFGSPCQDLSCANNRQKGLDGERSGLFYRAVEAIRICRPRWFLMENVASMKPSERTKISQALGDFYTNDFLGMYCEPVRINSKLVSAQTRDRLYWCNWNVNQPKDKGIILQDVLEQGGEALKEKSYALTATYKKDSKFRRQRTAIHQQKSLALTANYGKLNEKNFAKGQGQLVSMALKDKSPCVSTEPGGFTAYSKKHGYSETRDLIVDVPESFFEHDETYTLTAHLKNHDIIKVGNIKNDSISCRVYSPEGKATTQNANGGGQGCKTGLYKIGENVRKLTSRECCRLQTYDERVFNLFTINRKEAISEKPYMSKNSFYNVFGDSFTVDVIVHILRCNKEMVGQ
jgi:DNA (cytosine-5)-methyltransferase 3A